MTSAVRTAILDRLMSLGNYQTGQGFDLNADRLQYPGVPQGAYSGCARCATWECEVLGDHLPSMQAGCQHGFLGVQAGFQWAADHGFLRTSLQSEDADFIGFQWDGQGLRGNWQRMHVETRLRIDADGLWTRGFNSGPGGGMNTHCWVPGGSLIIGAINVEKLLAATAPFPAPHPVTGRLPDPRTQPIVPGWYRADAGPMGYRGGAIRKGGDVELVARWMRARKGYGGDPKAGYTAQLQQAVKVWQSESGLQADGFFGPASAAKAAQQGAR